MPLSLGIERARKGHARVEDHASNEEHGAANSRPFRGLGTP